MCQMGRPTATCAMCRLIKPLASSHLLPAAAWDHIRDGTNSPFLLTKDAVLTSDKQLHAYLLCDACELILSAGGENYVLPLLARQGRQFPLYELLKAHAESKKLTDTIEEFYVRDNSPIQGKKIAHFALGIFWKASVHAWKVAGGDANIDLGFYKEVLRLFLTGSIGWPGWAISLLVYVSKPEHLPLLRITTPALLREAPGVNAYHFEVPGMLFILQVGTGLSAEDREMCFGTSANHPIIVSDAMAQLAVFKNEERVGEARKTESYLRAFEKRSNVKPPKTK
jgi:hypothetical protein